MFWGLNLKPNRKYTQTTTKSFHISGAALDSDSSSGGTTQIYISSENQKFLICTLRKGGPEQVMLDLNFAEGEEICFQSIGSGNVSLAGYIIDNFMDGPDGEEEESELEDEEDMPKDLRNALNQKKKSKKAEVVTGDDDDEDDEEDDPDFNGIEDASDDDDVSGDEEVGDEDDDDDDEEVEEDDDDEDEEEEDESEDEEVQSPKAKQPKLEKPAKQQNGNVAAKVGSEKKDKKNKKEAQQQKQQQQQQQQQKQPKKDIGVERTITGGVKIIDLREGTGPEAKVGKRAQVYYEGRLKSNNKVFDSMKNGAGFKFPLGRGEVIKAWDVGVVGMKVGGKRRIICPPHMAYGARGSPPTIPPNSTLVFEVELKGVN